jgi:hypothetical protein
MDIVGIYMATRQIREVSVSSESSALGHSTSARCANAVNDMCRFLDISVIITSSLRTFSGYKKAFRLITCV